MKMLLSLPLLFVPLTAIGLLSAAPRQGDDHDGDDEEEIELDEAEVFIEFNSTDGDFGLQLFWDGEAWDRMKVEGANGRTVLKVSASRSVALQGLTEGFFESDEPSLDDLSMEEFLERFPEGEYEFEGITLEGEELEGETELTHTLPAPPSNLFPAAGAVIDASQPLVASFDAVTTDLNGAPLEPELYELVVETDDDDERVFTMQLDGDLSSPSVTVPPEFLKPGTSYKLEIIVQEESGNRVITEAEFETL